MGRQEGGGVQVNLGTIEEGELVEDRVHKHSCVLGGVA